MWKKCIKKQIEVEFREINQDETGVETLEGFKPCNADEHYIIKGISGELYPILKDIFNQTYDIVDGQTPRKDNNRSPD